MMPSQPLSLRTVTQSLCKSLMAASQQKNILPRKLNKALPINSLASVSHLPDIVSIALHIFTCKTN